ncbi:MAG: hypothetical protein K5668_01130, partial [Lachnospiraceae bacterium]|nr:hypothetical protein [Lachnospiraceae bacterium]
PRNVNSAPQKKPAKEFNVKVFIVSAIVIFVAVILVCCGAIILSSSGDSSDAAAGGNGAINQVDILIPYPKGEEALVNSTATLALHYDYVAQACLDKFMQYDLENGSVEEYKALLDDTVTAYENLETASACLEEAVDIWMATDDEESREEPQITGQTLIPTDDKLEPFIYTVYAAEDSPAMKWAKDITQVFDKAQAGTGVRTLAGYLGTDAKHAYAQLKQAQAIIENGAYNDEADLNNQCYKIAHTVKTGATVAGAIVAAVAAPASVTLTVPGVLEGVATIGGLFMGGVNSVCEVYSTGGLWLNNGEDNSVSARADQIEAKLAPLTATFSLLGAGVSAYKLGVNDMKAEGLIDRLYNEDSVGLIFTGYDTINEYVQEKTLVGGTLTKTDKGWKFTLMDTMLGDDEESREAAKKVLENAGVDPETAEAAVQKGIENRQQNIDPPEVEISDTLPSERIDAILEQNDGILPGQEGLDLMELLQQLDLLAEEKGIEPGSSGDPDTGEEDPNFWEEDNGNTEEDPDFWEEDTGNTEKGQDSDTEKPDTSNEVESTGNEVVDKICGTYFVEGTHTEADYVRLPGMKQERDTEDINFWMTVKPDPYNTFTSDGEYQMALEFTGAGNKHIYGGGGFDPETGKISKAWFTEQGICYFTNRYPEKENMAYGSISFTYGNGGKINADVDMKI